MSVMFAATHPERTAALILCGCYAKGGCAPDYLWGRTHEQHEEWVAELERDWGGPFELEQAAPSMVKDEAARGAGLNIGLLSVVGVVIWFTRDAIASVFTSNPVVHAPLVTAHGLVPVISIADGLQAVLIGATRGVADTVVPTVLQGVSFWVIMLPLNYYLGITAGFGIVGLFLALASACWRRACFWTRASRW